MEEKDKVKEQKRLGIGFITFGLENDAKRLVNDIDRSFIHPHPYISLSLNLLTHVLMSLLMN